MKAAVFLDRDGTINEEMGYINHLSRFNILPGVPEAIKLLNENNYLVIVVTNQSGLARGYFPEELLAAVHEKMQQMLAMIEMMRERQRLGGGQERPRREEGQQAQGEEGPQARERDQGGPPPGGFPERSPEEVAEQLKTSLEAISQSALYLKNAEFVK